MNKFFYTYSSLLLIMVLLLANPATVFADEGNEEHGLETEVNGVHVSLDSQNDWKKGTDTLTVTLMDSMGMPIGNADVQITLGPQSDEHAEPQTESAHGTESGHSGMEMEEHAAETAHTSTHEDEAASPIVLRESEEAGVYLAETQLEASGTQEVNVIFHVNDEMFQADFVVEIVGGLSKASVLWGFLALNVVLIASAGMLKRQSIQVKGGQ